MSKNETCAFKLARSSGVVHSRVSLVQKVILDKCVNDSLNDCNGKGENSYFEAKSGFKLVSPSRLAVITKHFPLLKKVVVPYKRKIRRVHWCI